MRSYHCCFQIHFQLALFSLLLLHLGYFSKREREREREREMVGSHGRDTLLVLVTGCCGFVSSHVVVELLLHDYSIRGTVRSQGQSKDLIDGVVQEIIDRLLLLIHDTSSSSKTTSPPTLPVALSSLVHDRNRSSTNGTDGDDTMLSAQLQDPVRAFVSSRFEEFVIDLMQDDGWEDACHQCDYVLHVASPFPTKIESKEKHPKQISGYYRVTREEFDAILKPAIMGTRR